MKNKPMLITPSELKQKFLSFLGRDLEIIEENIPYGVLYGDSNELHSTFHLAVATDGDLYIVAEKNIEALVISTYDPKCKPEKI